MREPVQTGQRPAQVLCLPDVPVLTGWQAVEPSTWTSNLVFFLLPYSAVS